MNHPPRELWPALRRERAARERESSLRLAGAVRRALLDALDELPTLARVRLLERHREAIRHARRWDDR